MDSRRVSETGVVAERSGSSSGVQAPVVLTPTQREGCARRRAEACRRRDLRMWGSVVKGAVVSKEGPTSCLGRGGINFDNCPRFGGPSSSAQERDLLAFELGWEGINLDNCPRLGGLSATAREKGSEDNEGNDPSRDEDVAVVAQELYFGQVQFVEEPWKEVCSGPVASVQGRPAFRFCWGDLSGDDFLRVALCKASSSVLRDCLTVCSGPVVIVHGCPAFSAILWGISQARTYSGLTGASFSGSV